jgi:predicted nucleic acid-binding protein
LYDEPNSDKAISFLRRVCPVISVLTISEIISFAYKKNPEKAIKTKVLIERLVGKENIISVDRQIAELAGAEGQKCVVF